MDLTASHPHLGTGTASARLTPLGFDNYEAVADSRARARPGEAPVGSSGGTYYIGGSRGLRACPRPFVLTREP